MNETKYLRIGQYKYPYDVDRGIYPIFQLSIRKRINAKKAVNIAITGEAGIGKSYGAITLAQSLDPKFDIDTQVVFNLKGFMEAVMNLKSGRPIVFDEPSYAIGKHDWYKNVNNALRKTMESFRYKLHPLIIPIISISLLDKTVRSYLLQYHVILSDRGKGRAYALSADQYGKDKTYYTTICDWHFSLLKEKCKEDSCLGCKTLPECNEWMAKYERKKNTIQEERYMDVLREAIAEEDRVKQSKLTIDDVLQKIAEHANELTLTQRKRIDRVSLKVLIEKHLHTVISDRKSEEYAKRFMLKHPDFIEKFSLKTP